MSEMVTHIHIYICVYALTNVINSSKSTNYIHSYMCVHFN